MATTDLWDRIWTQHPGSWRQSGGHRSGTPTETLRRLRPLLGKAGVTRLANVTDLDWVGIPVWQAIHPNSRLYSVSQGKGLTHTQALISAMMEALEQRHVEEITLPIVSERVGTMRQKLAYDPYTLTLSAPSVLTDVTPIDWLPATDLVNGAPTWAPRLLCDFDIQVRERLHLPLFEATTNGLAGGNTVAEAVHHGLCEVVERDSIWQRVHEDRLGERIVALDTITSRQAQRVLARFARAGLTTLVGDATGPLGLPCFEVWLDHPDGPGLGWGSGCHPRRDTALIRALTEAAQARATYIAGTRDDIQPSTYQRGEIDALLQHFGQAGRQARRYTEAPSLPRQSILDEIREMVSRILAATGAAPMVVDLTRPDFDLPMVFVLAPGLRRAGH